MKKILITILILFSCSSLWAQSSFPSENGLFNINYLKGCEFTEIEVTLNPGTGTPFICFDADLSDIASNNDCFGNPAQSAEDLQFTYQEAGIYNILFLRQLTNSQVYDSITIEIIDPEPPRIALANCNDGLVFDLNPQEEVFDFYTIDFGDGSDPQQYPITAFPFAYDYTDPTQEYTIDISGSFDNTGNNNCGNNSVSKTIVPENQIEAEASINSINLLSENNFEIEYEANENQLYQIQIKENSNGTYQTIDNISATTGGVYTFQNLNLVDNFYCVRIISTSNCDNTPLNSNEVCTIRFDASAQNNGNLLDWNHFSFENSELFKNGEIIYSGNAPYVDVNVLCGQTDTYSVVTRDQNGIELTSFSIEVSAITGSPSIPISQIATKVLSDSELELTWEVPAGLQPTNFVIYKKRNLTEDFFEVDTTGTNSYIDIGTAFTTRKFYYSIAYTNSCGGISPITTTASNILLKVNQNESIIDFTWDSYEGFDSLLSHYVIKKYDENMTILDENDLGDLPNYSENIAQSEDQLSFYQVEAYSENGLIAISNLLRYKIPSSFFVPTGFTPNDDALNQEIKVVGKFIEEVEFSIYNRWGTLIFRSNSLEIGWDGYLTNRPAPEGTYSYTVRVKDNYGEEYFKSGVFNLIR
ncbi:gliding motility-associated C-terminal domain-containing protein [Marivirga salinae]|uniref:Gliding motility-associated C-terminal domain-containing protein n=1 Tax=Marivirga salinarum TaxID=3059078 RepID=A0AA49J9C1_9BACT|nr:T9SS type B sorting domain-containing protein [Marivirga sp. BDSF4-3]WKK75701.2 gliding motility-associated C-terminal domain-containing protein [Marivirga sp. BDSF4-3]